MLGLELEMRAVELYEVVVASGCQQGILGPLELVLEQAGAAVEAQGQGERCIVRALVPERDEACDLARFAEKIDQTPRELWILGRCTQRLIEQAGRGLGGGHRSRPREP